MKKNIFSILLASAVILPFGLLAQTAVKSKTKTEQKPVTAVLSAKSSASIESAFTGSGEDWFIEAGKAVFPALPYSYEALEPVIDKSTVEIHYDRHHRGYFNNFMKAVAGTDLEKMSFYQIFGNMTDFPAGIRNNAGGFYNHVLYWSIMSADGGGKPSGKLLDAITRTFGSYDAFYQQFNDAAKTRFGSGWAWLSIDFKTDELFITSTANQDNPLMNTEGKRGFPILGIDVWEHAYYLKYQNKRADYVENFWNKLNWQEVQTRYNDYFRLADRLNK
ncbi:MAG: superoxide dismutase [Lentimicrobium sp.]|nr:superoxide dismutase [Lentimicrobium sp.]